MVTGGKGGWYWMQSIVVFVIMPHYVGLRHIAHGWCNQISCDGATTLYEREVSELSLKLTKYLFCSQLIALFCQEDKTEESLLSACVCY